MNEVIVILLLTADPPVVSIMEMGSNVAGVEYSLVCEVMLTAGSATAMWVHNDVEVTEGVSSSGQETIAVTLTLTFSPLTYQDGGTYTCVGIAPLSNPSTTNSSVVVNVQGKQVVLRLCYQKCTGSNTYYMY